MFGVVGAADEGRRALQAVSEKRIIQPVATGAEAIDGHGGVMRPLLLPEE